jgi:hypothetical protein
MEEAKNGIIEKFQKKYEKYFKVSGFFLNLTPISFCNENGSRLDVVIKFKLEK